MSALILLAAWTAIWATAFLLAARLAPAGRLDLAVTAVLIALSLTVADALALGVAGALSRGALLTAAAGQLAVAAMLALTVGRCRERLAGAGPAVLAACRDLITALWRAPLQAALLALAAFMVVKQIATGLVLGVQDYDGLSYHLPMVMTWVRTKQVGGRITESPFGDAYPGNLELHAAWTMALFGDDLFTAAAQVPFALLLVLTTVAVARRCGLPHHWALASGALVLLAPTVVNQLAMLYNDVAGAAAFVAGLHLLAVAADRLAKTGVDGPVVGRLAIGGLGLGLAAGTKPAYAVGAIATLGILIVVLLVRRAPTGARPTRRLRTAVITAAVVIAALAPLGLPFYLRNIVLFGNPLAPFAMDVGPLHLPGRFDLHKITVGPSTPPELAGSPGHVIMAAVWSGFQPAKSYWRVQQNFGWQWTYLQAPALLVWLVWLAVGRLLRRGPVRGGLYHLIFLVPALVLLATNPTPWIFRYVLVVLIPGVVAGCLALHGLTTVAVPLLRLVRRPAAWPVAWPAMLGRAVAGIVVLAVTGSLLWLVSGPALKSATRYRIGHADVTTQRFVPAGTFLHAARSNELSLRITAQPGARWAQQLPAGSRIGVLPWDLCGQLYGRRAQNRLVVLSSIPPTAFAQLEAGTVDYVLFRDKNPLTAMVRRRPDRYVPLESAAGLTAYAVVGMPSARVRFATRADR